MLDLGDRSRSDDADLDTPQHRFPKLAHRCPRDYNQTGSKSGTRSKRIYRTSVTATFSLESIVLDREGSANLHRQLYGQLRGMIESRALAAGTALPSTRLLAKDLGLGRNTVIAAYDQLALEGFLKTRRGAPPKVMDLPSRDKTQPGELTGGGAISARGRIMLAQPYHHGAPGLLAFHPGLPDPGNFPFNTWSKLLTRGPSSRPMNSSAPITWRAIRRFARPSPDT